MTFTMIFRLFAFAVLWLVCLIPTWIFLLARYLLHPEGFWQNLLVYGLGFYVLGGFQVVLFIAAVFFSVALIVTDP